MVSYTSAARQRVIMHPYSDTLITLPCIASWWDNSLEEHVHLGYLVAEFHSGQCHGPAPASLRIVFSPDTVDERGVDTPANTDSQVGLIITNDHLADPLSITTAKRNEIPHYIQDQLRILRDIHGKAAMASGVCYIRLMLLKLPTIMAPKNTGTLKSAVDLRNLTAFKALAVKKNFRLWFFENSRLGAAIDFCGSMLGANTGFLLPVPATHFKFLPHSPNCWPEFRVHDDTVMMFETVIRGRDPAGATTHTEAEPQSLFIERLLEKMPKDRERSTTLPWPRGRKRAADFFQTSDEYFRIARHMGLNPHDPKALAMVRAHWGQAAEDKFSAELAEEPPTKRRRKSSSEITQSGSGAAADDDILMSELSDDLDNSMEVD